MLIRQTHINSVEIHHSAKVVFCERNTLAECGIGIQHNNLRSVSLEEVEVVNAIYFEVAAVCRIKGGEHNEGVFNSGGEQE